MAEDQQRAVAEVRVALGPVTILVNNAAFTVPGRPGRSPARPAPADDENAKSNVEWPTFAGTPLKAYQRHFQMVYAAYDLMQMVVPDMYAEGYGAIVNVSSGASRMPGEGPYPSDSDRAIAGYGGSKLALEHLTHCVASELQDHDIAVNALLPSKPIRTPGQSYYSATWDEYGSESDFAEAAVRLCLVLSNEITGRTVGHDNVLDGTFASYEHTIKPAKH